MTNDNRYKSIKFSTSQRDTTKEINSTKFNPGPGAYNLPSVFDLKRKYKSPIN